MIIERSNTISLKQLQEQLPTSAADVPDIDEVKKFMGFYQLCHQAVNEVAARLENLDEDYSMRFDHNPIHHMETRMKNPGSLVKKMQKKGVAFSTQAVRANIFDLGGIRVINNYVKDVYTIAENLTDQADIQVIRQKDYVQHPKASGYRSLHLVVTVPVYQSSGVQRAPVEIQIRTIGMDLWASLEHKLRYKTTTSKAVLAPVSTELTHYASELSEIETHMQTIFTKLSALD
jgi:putative GTP pyrophosphokinase